jgi:leucyl-tRNA synthetase
MMEFVNYLQRGRDGMAGTPAWTEAARALVLLLAPIAPHLSEELWERLGEPYSVHQQRWPAYDPALAQAELITLVLQVDGKVRDRIQVSADLGEAEARELALRNEKVKKFVDGRSVADVVVVPRRLVNVVTK